MDKIIQIIIFSFISSSTLIKYQFSIILIRMMLQSVQQNWFPEPTKNLVESLPVKDGIKLSNTTWEDLRGLY